MLYVQGFRVAGEARSEFLVADFDKVLRGLREPIVVDLRNGLSELALSTAKLDYLPIGKERVSRLPERRAAQ